MNKHTPTPWFVTETRDESNCERYLINQNSTEPVLIAVCDTVETLERDFISPENAKANAAFIVRAVNEHEALVSERDRLKAEVVSLTKSHEALVLNLESVLQEIELLIEDGTLKAEYVDKHPTILEARQALALAKGSKEE